MTIDAIKSHLTDVNSLVGRSSTEKGEYVHPSLRRLGATTIVLVREIIAPTVFRNTEEEITDILVPTEGESVQAVRAVPNKFKHRERAKGLQIARHFGIGGKYPQNKTNAPKDAKPSEFFDINSFLFGDSTLHNGKVLPVKAASLYSDGLSTVEYVAAVGSTTHNRASEDGTLFDAAKKENSSALFNRHFILPGTMLVQTITTVGKVMPAEILDHLLLCVGHGGVYGGQTSITGVNVRTHVAGIYAGKLEQPESSPYVAVGKILNEGGMSDVREVIKSAEATISPVYEAVADHEEVTRYLSDLVDRFEKGDDSLTRQYEETASKVGELFDEWFNGKAV